MPAPALAFFVPSSIHLPLNISGSRFAISPAARAAVRVVAICVTALAVAWVIGQIGLVDAVERRVEDVAAFVGSPSPAARNIVLVRIIDKDYWKPALFERKSPLKHDVLLKLIEAVAKHRPAVIGVDISTAPPSFEALRGRTGATVVWARDGAVRNKVIQISPVLGYSSVEAEGEQEAAAAGVALLLYEADGVVRAYQRWMPTSHGPRPSFTCAMINACAADPGCRLTLAEETVRGCGDASAPDFSERLIAYRHTAEQLWESTRFDAGELLDTIGDEAAWARALSNKIVLIGGVYAESGDTDHATPLGVRPGIEVTAHILATELGGGGATPSGGTLTAILAAFEMYLILLVTRSATWWRRIGWGVALVASFAVGASVWNEGSLSRTWHFAAVLVGVLLIQAAVRYVEHSQELFVGLAEELRSRYRR